MKTRRQYTAIYRALIKRHGLPHANGWRAENSFEEWRKR